MALVTASRAPELRPRPSIPRSLQSLATRSLRDLQAAKATPPPQHPPPTLPEKPFAPSARVVSPESVQRVNLPSLDVSYRVELDDMFSASLEHSSFFSSTDRRNAFEMKRQSCQDLSQSSKGTVESDRTTRASLGSAHERHPPIDPRKSRRYCTDFGLGRNQLPNIPDVPISSPTPPVEGIHSLVSTPVTAYTDTDETESIASILDYPFPQPPTFEDQFKLRRMHSSPLIVVDDLDSFKHVTAKRYSAFVARSEVNHVTSPFSLASIPDEGTESATPESVYSSLSSPQPAIYATPSVQHTNSFRHSRTLTEPSNVRKHAPHNQEPSKTEARSFISLKPSIDSLHRFHVSMERLKKWDPQRSSQRESNANNNDLPDYKPHRRGPAIVSFQAPPSLAAAGRQRPSHKPHMSTALTGLGLTSSAGNNGTHLGAPFKHRSTRSHPALRATAQKETVLPKSFIDITPERPESRAQRLQVPVDVNVGKRDRVKKLLHRASTIFNWNKAFGRKK